jgi:adenine-specific DNA methylase
MSKTIQPEVETTDRVCHQIKEYANDRNIDMARAWGELVAAGLESKHDNKEKNIEESYRAFEQINREINDQWEGVSREATDLLGPAPAIETEDGEIWEPESGGRG